MARAGPLPGLAAALVASVVLAVCFGPVAIAPERALGIIWSALTAGSGPVAGAPNEVAIVVSLRLPRVLLGVLVGASLAAVGCVLQTATRNPLADPYLFGISAGGALGVVTVMLWLGPFVGSTSASLAAFLGALGATALVMGVAGRHGRLPPDRLILAGVAVSFILMAATNFLIYMSDYRNAPAVLFWMLGGLGRARWTALIVPCVVTLAGLGFLLARARDLNALLAGDETATTLGVNVPALRLQLLGVCAMMTGTAVALSGSIGFVGLMLPHAMRWLVGTDHRRLLPVTALAGAVFLVWVDVCARTVLAPEDLPIGIFTAAIGGAFFLWRMQRRAG